MKKALRFLSILMCLTIVFCAIPQSVFAELASTLAQESVESESPVEDDSETYVLGEMIDLRTETSKTFRMSDGSYVLTDYAQTVHYQAGEDIWLDYDNTLISSAAAIDEDDFAGMENMSSDVRVKFANNSNSSNLVKITFGDYKISLHLIDAAKSTVAEIQQPIGDVERDGSIDQASALGKYTSGVVYHDILANTDLEYRLFGGSVKENIIVKERQGKYSYTFELKLNGLIPAVTAKGSIALNDEKSGETVLIIPAGYMYDANGEASDAVAYSVVSQNGKKYTLTVTADAGWMNADDRAFPVIIDPSVEAFKGVENTGDTYISQNSPNDINYGKWETVVGYYYNNTAVEWHGLIEPLTPPALPASATVTSATMRLFHMDTGYTSVTIAASAIQSNWDSKTVTWNTRPSYSSEILDYKTLSSKTQNAFVDWDITRLVQEWYAGTTTCWGVALYPISGGGSGHVYLGSSEFKISPLLIVSYRDTKGLEGIWQYSAQSAGSAGTGYVNGFNGNLVFVHDDMTTQGSILPIAVSHVYNQYQVGEEFSDIMKVGKGWKLSVQETLRGKTLDGVTWYVYTDADGTDLYFYWEDVNKYVSEDGNGLTLSTESTPYITDTYGNKKLFNSSGNISEIRDVLGNKKTFVYNTSNQLTSITYTPSDSTAKKQLTFAYNASGALYRITNAYDTTDYVTFYYSTTYNGDTSTSNNGYLRQISYSKGGSCIYKYTPDGKLQDAQDGDTQYSLYYAYKNGRVASVLENGYSAGRSIPGQKLGFYYSDKKFTIQSSGSDDLYATADDLRTTYIFDDYGRTICSYTTNNTETEVYGAAYAAYTTTSKGSRQNNKITADSIKGTTVANLLLNGNAESTSNWSGATSGSGYSSGYYTTNKFLGNGSLQFTATTSANNTGYARRYQTVTIPSAGTYTLSAYIKTSNVKTLSASGGAYLILDGAESEKLTGTTNTSIQNGWQRVSVTKTFTSAGSYQVQLRLGGATGTAYFDCIQLEKAEVPSNFNLIQNSDISLSSGWSSFETSNVSGRGKVMRVAGNANSYNYKSQTIQMYIPKDTTLMLSGWGKAASTPTGVDGEGHNRTFRLVANILYTDGTREDQAADFNPDYTDWQYSAAAIIPKEDVASITIYLSYDFNVNTAYFDDICLTVEPAQTYTYDENGNMESLIDENGKENSMIYAANGVDLASFTNTVGEKYEYTYKTANGTDTHLVQTIKKSTLVNTQTLEYDYDAYGNITSSTLTANGTTEQVKSTATYSDYGNYLSTVTDSLGKTTRYNYLNDLLNYVTNANKHRTAYQYDSRKRMTTVYLDSDKDGTLDSNEAAVYYTYLKNRLSGINTATTLYTLTYDMYGNTEQIKAGNNILASYSYGDSNGKLKTMTLGNGNHEEYFYDLLDRLIEVQYNGNTTYKLTYDANGRLYRCVDAKSGITHQYEYDSLGRLIRAWQKKTSTGETLLAVENSYDEYGRAKDSAYVIDGKTKEQRVYYKTNSNLVSSVHWSHLTSTPQFTYKYDSFDRLISKSVDSWYIPDIYTDYTYETRTIGGVKYTSTLVAEEKLRAGSNTTVYTYFYDSLGNITEVEKNKQLAELYVYDALNRLVQAYDVEAGISYEYTYDHAGNILSKGENGINTTYTYSSSAWGDLLTNYDGTSISYDTIGNPLNWRNDSNLTWNGRTLTRVISNNGFRGVQFAYNADGIRTYKSHYNHSDINMYHISYVLDGTKILKETYTHEITGEVHTLDYFYDEKGEVAGFEYNGSAYFYQKNIQGDVLRICDEYGYIVAEYTYDAWGKILSVTDAKGNAITDGTHVANLNPFRYRSYYYDSETGFYYLNSRYYDPEVGRFLNADTFVSTGTGIVGYNMFAYCNNNPVIYKDPSGNASFYFQKDSLNDLIKAISDGGGGSGGGHLPPKKELEELDESIYDSNRHQVHGHPFRERLFGVSWSAPDIVVDDCTRILLELGEAGFYGYKIKWDYPHLELEGTLGSAYVFASIGGDSVFSIGAQTSAVSGSFCIKIGRFEICFAGYVGGVGGTFKLFSSEGTGGSLCVGIGGGIFVKWN
ncbi:MAG: DNRLRE domain-containing protein [Oscillospiraceae bacterium]|nr:DNRLRE domain-containing protein [Oscillospiraceae bacterium]